MKKILFASLFLSSVAYGQLAPPGYTKVSSRYKWIAGIFDQGLHVPQYNGVPTDRTGVWIGDGAVAIDSLNGYFYYRNGGVWIKVAKFSDIAAALLRFGVPGQDERATAGRRFSGATNAFTLDSLGATMIRTTSTTAMHISAANATDSAWIDIRRANPAIANVKVDINSSYTNAGFANTGRVLVGGILQGGSGMFSNIGSTGYAGSITTQGDVSILSFTPSYSHHFHMIADTFHLDIHRGNFYMDTLSHSNAGTDKMVVWDSASGRIATRLIPTGGGGSGDVTKVGTPVNNQLGVWTGDGTIEGDGDLTFNGTDLAIGGQIGVTGKATFSAAAAIAVEIPNGGGYEIKFTGSSPSSNFFSEATGANGMFFNTAGGPIWFGNSDGAQNLRVVGGSVGIDTDPSEKLHVSGNIRFSGALMPNNAAGTSGQVLTSAGAGSPPTWVGLSTYFGASTYTPTLTNTANLDASTSHVFQYSWITDPTTLVTVVTVSGYVTVDPTTTLTDTQLTISTPITPGFTNIQECGGVGASTTIASSSAAIRAVASSANVMMQWKCVDTTSHSMFLTFTYKINAP